MAMISTEPPEECSTNHNEQGNINEHSERTGIGILAEEHASKPIVVFWVLPHLCLRHRSDCGEANLQANT